LLHLMMAVALFTFVGLEAVFVTFSDTPDAALTFAILSIIVLLLLSGSAGSFAGGTERHATLQLPVPGPGMVRFWMRTLLAAAIPAALLLLIAFIPDLDDPPDPSATLQLVSTIAVFWMLMSLALAGVVLGFLWPRTGALEAVITGALVVLVQSLLSWGKADASRDAVQLALYTWMVWVSICLIGAWLGSVLRQVGHFNLSVAWMTEAKGDGRGYTGPA